MADGDKAGIDSDAEPERFVAVGAPFGLQLGKRALHRLGHSHGPHRMIVLGHRIAELHRAGFDRLELRPFFSPQRMSLPRPALAALHALERTPAARLLLRYRFSFLCAAFRGGRNS